MAVERGPGLGTILRRIVRIACPACGKGPLFERYFLRTEKCSHCRRRFERGAGYWVGGSEVHMFVSYGLSVVICIPILLFAGPTPGVMAGVVGLHVALSLLLFRYSRAVFLGFDYLLDPGTAAPGNDDPESGGGPPPRPRTPPSRARRRARPHQRGSERPRPHKPAGA